MQFSEEQDKFLRQILSVMRIIAGTLMAGVVIFLGVVVFLIEPEKPVPPMLAYVGVGAALIAVVASYVIPGFLYRQIIQSLIDGTAPPLPIELWHKQELGVIGPLLYIYHMRQIVSLAILEGAAFFNVIAYMIERQQVSLLMVALLLAAMVLRFPTRHGVQSRLSNQIKFIDDHRSLRT